MSLGCLASQPAPTDSRDTPSKPSADRGAVAPGVLATAGDSVMPRTGVDIPATDPQPWAAPEVAGREPGPCHGTDATASFKDVPPRNLPTHTAHIQTSQTNHGAKMDCQRLWGGGGPLGAGLAEGAY
jgi:hypothetical protein